jgi:transketolase
MIPVAWHMGMALTWPWRCVFHLQHKPPTQWLNRDRLLLSNGHGSMLIYAAAPVT